MKNPIYLILISLVFQGCLNTDRKSDPTIIDFTFKDFYSGNAVAGVKVSLTKKRFNLMGSPTYEIATFETDVNGKIAYSFQNEQSHLYYISPKENEEYGGFLDANLKTGQKNSQTISVKQFNVLKINLINSTKKYQNVELNFQEEFAPYSSFKGAFKDTSILFKSIPETNFAQIRLQFDTSKVMEFQIDIPKIDTFNVSYQY
ncbi:MAG: hypothetical protein WC760_12295 [Bacteroidia bacterium]|jgi:hypothetical protein